MASSESPELNGINVEDLQETIEAVSENPELARFAFRAKTEWTDALKGKTTIAEFDQAGELIQTKEFHVDGMDQSRSWAIELPRTRSNTC